MPTYSPRVLVIAALVGYCAVAAAYADDAGGEPGPYDDPNILHADDQIIVILRPGALHGAPGLAGRANPANRDVRTERFEYGEPPDISEAFDELWTRWQVSRMRRLHSPPFKNSAAAIRRGMNRTYVLEVPPGTDAIAMAAAFSELKETVEYAGVDAVGRVAGELIPDDPSFSTQYAMRNIGQTGGFFDADIDATEAWEIHTGNRGTVTIAIIDSGVTRHAEFAYCDGGIYDGVVCRNDSLCKACIGGERDTRACCVDGVCMDGFCDGGDRHGLECCPGGDCDKTGECIDRMVPGINTDDPDSNVCDGGDRDSDACCPGGGLCGAGVCSGGSRDGLTCCPNGVCDPFTADHCGLSGHGTHVAGIAAAAGNNSIGVAGVSWGANIMPVRVLLGCGGRESAAANGIHWAVDQGADIINISLQFYSGGMLTLRNAVEYAHDNDVLVVSAAGNNNEGGVGKIAGPARFLSSMSVTGTTDQDRFATTETTGDWSSNSGEVSFCETGPDHGLACEQASDCRAPGVCVFGDAALCEGGSNHAGPCQTNLNCPDGGVCVAVDGLTVDVSAPGDTIFSTLPISYGFKDGTSMAAPHVSGLAALIKSYNLGLSADEIREIIQQTAEDQGPSGWDSEYGHGRINARNALLGASAPRILSSIPSAEAIDARQPSQPDGTGPTGWQWVDMLVGGDLSALSPASFDVTQEPNDGAAPSVVAVQPLEGELNVRVILSDTIAIGAWTTITHVDSGGSIRLGYLAGDVDGSGTADAADVVALIDAISGSGDPLPDWSADIDRSGRVTPADLLREIDLLMGAETYEVFNGATLP